MTRTWTSGGRRAGSIRRPVEGLDHVDDDLGEEMYRGSLCVRRLCRVLGNSWYLLSQINPLCCHF
jgi:hypothetical protein